MPSGAGRAVHPRALLVRPRQPLLLPAALSVAPRSGDAPRPPSSTPSRRRPSAGHRDQNSGLRPLPVLRPTRSHAAAAAGVRAPPGRPEPRLPSFPASRLCAPSALASEGDERAARLFIRNRDAVCPPRDTPASSCPRAPVLGTGLGAFPWTHVEQLAGDVRVVTAARPSSRPDDDF